MGRAVRIQEDEVHVRLTGLTALAAFRRELRIPVRAVRTISTEPFGRVGRRVLGTSIPFTSYRQGRFRQGSLRLFLSFESRDSTVTLEVSRTDWDEPYDVVVLGVPDSSEFAEALRAKRR